MLQEKEENKKLKLAELGGGELIEHNMLAASWVNDITSMQKEFEHRKIFYMNESLLIEENIRKHFDPRNDRKFHAHGQEFLCVKGAGPKLSSATDKMSYCQQVRNNDNKNSFFSIIDGDIKIIGLFDGHGEQGHLVSSAAMGIMLDYLRNRNDVFRTKSINSETPEKMQREIKKAFKYTNMILR